MKIQRWIKSNAIKAELLSFSHAIKNNRTPLVSIDDGYKALEVAYMIIDKIKASSNFIDDPEIQIN